MTEGVEMAMQRTEGPDEGFGLIEMVVALLIAGLVFGALATTLVAGVRASAFGRQNQQATDLMTQQLERLRALDFGSLGHDPADPTLAADSHLSSCGTTLCLTVDGTPEPLVIVSYGGIMPHTRTISDTTVNNTTYTVSSFITAADQPVDQAVRATVYVSWSTNGTTHERSTSSMIAFAQRGLPLPRFKLEMPVTALSVNPGGTVTYVLTLLNQGAPDRWDLALSGSTSGWSLMADTDGDGVLSAADTALADTTGNGVVDTGRIDPSTTFRFFLTRHTSPSAALGTFDTVVTATSAGQPSATGASASVTATTTITTGTITPGPGPSPSPTTSAPSTETTCAAAAAGTVTGVGSGGYSVYEHVLHNDSVGDTALEPQMYMNRTVGDEPYLPSYSTDVDSSVTGRVIEASSSSTGSAVLALSDPKEYADWQMTADKKSWLDGTGVVRIWVAPYGGSMPTDLTVVLYSATTASSARTVLAEASATIPAGCSGFQEVYVTLPDVPQPEVPKNGVFGIRLAVSGGDGRLAYDVPSQMPASFTLGVKS